jgi:hypothetical protein
VNQEKLISNGPPLPNSLRPQFRLITLLLLITLVALILAAFQSIGPIGTFALILAILVVIAHVSGNAIGTAMRDGARPDLQPREVEPLKHALGDQSAPVTSLGEKHPLGRPIFMITAFSAPFWGILGITIAKIISTKPISLPNSIAGALVLAALGAFWTFVAGSFIQVAFGAFFHALRNSKPPSDNR